MRSNLTPAALSARTLLALFLATSWVSAQNQVEADKEKSPAAEAAKDKSDPPARERFFRWIDNSVSLLPYGWNYEVDPSEQTTLSLEHVHESSATSSCSWMSPNSMMRVVGMT